MAKKESKVTSAADLRSKDEAALQKEVADLQRAHFNLACKKALNSCQTCRSCVPLAVPLLVPKLFWLSNRLLNNPIEGKPS